MSHSSGSSFFHFFGVCLPPGLSGLFCPSFVLLPLLSDPLFVLGDDWYSYMIVCSHSLLVLLFIIEVVLDRTSRDGEFGDGFRLIIPSHDGGSLRDKMATGYHHN